MKLRKLAGLMLALAIIAFGIIVITMIYLIATNGG